MKVPLTLSLSLLIAIIALSTGAKGEELVFKSGFEDSSMMIGGPDLVGYDYSTGMDWVYDLDKWQSLEGEDWIGYFTFDYGNKDTGNDTTRKVELTPDPENLENQVLKYWIKEANNPISSYPYSKGRVQSNVYNNGGFENFTYSISTSPTSPITPMTPPPMG